MTHTITETRDRMHVVEYEWGGMVKSEVYASSTLALHRAQWLLNAYLVDRVTLDGRKVR